jgi:hypothetical protein
MTDPRLIRARELLARTEGKSVEWLIDSAEREERRLSGEPDAQELWQRTAPKPPRPEPKLVRERQVNVEDADQMISDLRDELTGVIEDAISNLRDELSGFAVEAAATAAEECGTAIQGLRVTMMDSIMKLARAEYTYAQRRLEERIVKLEAERGLRLVKSNDAA